MSINNIIVSQYYLWMLFAMLGAGICDTSQNMWQKSVTLPVNAWTTEI